MCQHAQVPLDEAAQADMAYVRPDHHAGIYEKIYDEDGNLIGVKNLLTGQRIADVHLAHGATSGPSCMAYSNPPVLGSDFPPSLLTFTISKVTCPECLTS